MMNQMTYHARVERAARIEAIKEKIGFGQVIKKDFHNGVWHYVTDTGVKMVVDADGKTIVTVYLLTVNELVRIYNGRNRVPKFLIKKVDRNQSLFIDTFTNKTLLGM